MMTCQATSTRIYIYIYIYIYTHTHTHTHTHTRVCVNTCMCQCVCKYIYTGWNNKIVTLEKTIWLHFRFNENHFFFVADHLLVGQLCINPKSDRSLLSYLKVTQCSTSEIGDALLYNSCSLPIQVMTTGSLPAPPQCKSGLPRITETCPGW